MIKERIKNKEKIFGTHMNMGDFWVADIFGMSDFEYVWVDSEHSPMDYKTLLQNVTILKAHGKAVFMRTQINDFNHTKRLLEMGVDGIVFPMVETAEQAKECMSYTYYPPKGIRGFGPNRAVEYGKMNVPEYMQNEDRLCRFIQLETPKAIENLEQIILNPDIDGYILGPCDMAANCGKLNDFKNEEVLAQIKKAIKILKDNGKYVGVSIGATDRETQKMWIDMGVDMISSGSDTEYIFAGVLKNAKQLSSLLPK